MRPIDPPVLEFRLLGPVEASWNGETLPIGGPRQRTVLAILLLAGGETVPAERLGEELSSDAEPLSDGAVRTYVSRLRSSLRPHAELDATAQGYFLRVDDDRVDASRFEALVKQAERALSEDRPGRSSTLLSEALELWRGPALAGIAGDGQLRMEAERLDELRLHAASLQVEAELALGRPAGMIERLEALVEQNPYREGLWRQLMLALYQSGRQADALAAYRRARAALNELGIEPGPPLQELEVAILRQEVAIRPPRQRLDRVPLPLTTFIGRNKEVRAVGHALRDSRIVTLVGMGGIGKTRIALEVAARSVGSFPDGVVFVDLSAIADGALIGPAVVGALGLAEQSGLPASVRIGNWLRDREMLIVLDNCEQVREDAAEVVNGILTAAPGTRVLVTSRVALALPGERRLVIGPMNLVAESFMSDAVALFVDRSRLVRPHDADDDLDALRPIADICARLEGLPLAIELAAARTRALSPAEIATRLQDRFGFLVSAQSGEPARHLTLEAALDWSYDLLAVEERSLLDQLSVFAGGASLEAIEAVCLDGDGPKVITLIERLADSSFLTPLADGQATRYHLLETIREYAAARLEQSGLAGDTRQRHARYFLSLAERAWAPTRQETDGQWHQRLVTEQDNLRAALAWSRETSDRETLLRLSDALWWFWMNHGDLAEGVAWLEAALADADDLDAGLRGRGFLGLASLALLSGDFPMANGAADEARVILSRLDTIATPDGPAQATRFEAGALEVLGSVALSGHDTAAAMSLYEQGKALFGRLEEGRWKDENLAIASINLGLAALASGDRRRATAEFDGARAIWDGIASVGVAICDLYLGLASIGAGTERETLPSTARALGKLHAIGSIQYSIEGIEIVAGLTLATGDRDSAARLLHSASAMRAQSGLTAVGSLADLRNHLVATLGDDTGHEETLSPAEAVALAAELAET